MKKIIFIFTFFFFITYGYSQDRLILKSGKKMEGRFIRFIGKAARFKIHKGKRVTYKQKEIKELFYTDDYGEELLFKHRNIKGIPKDLFSHELTKGQLSMYLVVYRGAHSTTFYNSRGGTFGSTSFTNFETTTDWYIIEKGDENARLYDINEHRIKIENALDEIVKENNLNIKEFKKNYNDFLQIIKSYNEYYELYNSNKKIFKNKPKLTKEEKLQKRLEKIEERKKRRMKMKEDRERKRKEKIKKRKDSMRVN